MRRYRILSLKNPKNEQLITDSRSDTDQLNPLYEENLQNGTVSAPNPTPYDPNSSIQGSQCLFHPRNERKPLITLENGECCAMAEKAVDPRDTEADEVLEE